MAYQYPKSLQNLINELARLPGLGGKNAQRLAFFLLSDAGQEEGGLAQAVDAARASVRPCPLCGNYTDQELCPVCSDDSREQGLLCVVENVADLVSLERSGRYHGRYHVLGGVISPLDGIGPSALRVEELLRRVAAGGVSEIILATNPTAEGEATALYLAKRLHAYQVAVTRLAHGLPVGGSLAFTDEATLDLALSGRKPL